MKIQTILWTAIQVLALSYALTGTHTWTGRDGISQTSTPGGGGWYWAIPFNEHTEKWKANQLHVTKVIGVEGLIAQGDFTP